MGLRKMVLIEKWPVREEEVEEEVARLQATLVLQL